MKATTVNTALWLTAMVTLAMFEINKGDDTFCTLGAIFGWCLLCTGALIAVNSIIKEKGE